MDLEHLIRHKSCHETRFYKILFCLSEIDVQRRFFLESLKFLSDPELQIIVEERNCKDFCGYILCNNINQINPTVKLQLNVAKQKIFDVSNRKKFCSDWCYAAHKYISDQLLKEPLWKNNNNINNQIYKLYPKDGDGCPGEIHCIENEIISDEKVFSKEIVKKPLRKICQEDFGKHIDNKQIRKIENGKSLDKSVKKEKDYQDVVNRIKERSKANQPRKTIMLNDDLNGLMKSVTVEDTETHLEIRRASEIIISWITNDSRDFICNVGEINENENIDFTKIKKDPYLLSLPNLDCNNQKEIQIGILLKLIKKNSPSTILSECGIQRAEFMTQFGNFLLTCRLTSMNISMSSREFRWVVIFLTDILSSKLSVINFDKDVILKKYGLTQVRLYYSLLSNIQKIINEVQN